MSRSRNLDGAFATVVDIAKKHCLRPTACEPSQTCASVTLRRTEGEDLLDINRPLPSFVT